MTPRSYKWNANTAFASNLAWVAVLILGSWVGFVWHGYQPIAKVIMWSTIVSQLLWCGCPLTTIEQQLRSKYSDVTYYGSFVCHVLRRCGIQVRPAHVTVGLFVIFVMTIAVVRP